MGFRNSDGERRRQVCDWYGGDYSGDGWRKRGYRSGYGDGPEQHWPWQRLCKEGEARPRLEGESNRGREAAAFNNPEAWPRFRRFVTFYFTNFPPQLSNFFLRKGFEVCGLLEEVVVPSRRNALGEVYGFVKFSNVRDVDKLLKALNSVWFGNLRVQAKVARFDKAAAKEEVNVRGPDGRAKGVRSAEVRLDRKGDNNLKLIVRESTAAVEGVKKDDRVQAEYVVKEGGTKEVCVGAVKIRVPVEKEKGG